MQPEVLIVDDSDFMRRVLREILAREFHIVAEAENGVQAVEKYREHDPDIVLMDIVMPIRNGLEATRMIIDHDPSARIIMCTSIGQEQQMQEAIQAGASGYITKPFQKPSVIEELQQTVLA